ncbi:hypothetical protein ISCGN_019705 [Ixodes scapularis]
MCLPTHSFWESTHLPGKRTRVSFGRGVLLLLLAATLCSLPHFRFVVKTVWERLALDASECHSPGAKIRGQRDRFIPAGFVFQVGSEGVVW